MTSGELDDILISKLKERGQRVTPQRLVIHRAMAERDQHLTAEQVLEMVSSRLPGTSLPTVYATLELFEKLGLIRRISSASGASLFDSRTSPHAHAICRGCGAVADIELVDASLEGSLDELASGMERGFSVDHAEVLIWGSCAVCATQATAVS